MGSLKTLSEKGDAGFQHFLLFPQCFHKASSMGSFHSLPSDKILDRLKLKAFTDDKINVTKKKLTFVLGRVENIVGKGENAGYQHFLLFPQCFQKLSFPEVLKVGILW